MVLRDERAAIPIGSYQRAFVVTLSLPNIVGNGGVISVLQPELFGGGAQKEAGKVRCEPEGRRLSEPGHSASRYRRIGS
jgi:hypothetical protein